MTEWKALFHFIRLEAIALSCCCWTFNLSQPLKLLESLAVHCTVIQFSNFKSSEFISRFIRHFIVSIFLHSGMRFFTECPFCQPPSWTNSILVSLMETGTFNNPYLKEKHAKSKYRKPELLKLFSQSRSLELVLHFSIRVGLRYHCKMKIWHEPPYEHTQIEFSPRSIDQHSFARE